MQANSHNTANGFETGSSHNEAPLKGESARPRVNRREWITNEATEYVNSLCPNAQYPFPSFAWCSHQERDLLQAACRRAFWTTVKGWRFNMFARLKELNTTEMRVLTVIEMKTLRFNKFLEKIPRKTFVHGDPALDVDGFEIVPISGLSDGKLSEGLASLKKKNAVGCIKADAYKGRDPSNIYCVSPVFPLIKYFFERANAELLEMHDRDEINETRCNILITGLQGELEARCGDIFEEDQKNFRVG